MSRDTDPRPLTPDTPAEWMDHAATEDVVVMLEADAQTVFVARVDTDAYERGYRWIANSVDSESGARTSSFATHENLIERWFREAVPRGRAWTLGWDETPLERPGGEASNGSEGDIEQKANRLANKWGFLEISVRPHRDKNPVSVRNHTDEGHGPDGRAWARGESVEEALDYALNGDSVSSHCEDAPWDTDTDRRADDG